MHNPSPQDITDFGQFNWSELWREPNRVSTLDDGLLANGCNPRNRQTGLVRVFDQLAGELSSGGRVLDVGCGNGAGVLSLLEAADRQHKELSILAIDTAEIHPEEFLARRVCFRSGRAEELGLPDGNVELVLSCFGVEFFEQDAFLAECCRVLQPGGRSVFLTFATESPQLLMQARYVAVYEHGLQQLITCVETESTVHEDLVERVRFHIEQDVPQPRFREHLHRLVEELTQRPGLSSLPLDHACFSDAHGRRNVFSVRTLKRRFALMQVIQRAALDALQARQLARRMHFAGLDQSRVVPLESQGRLQCWLLTGQMR